MKPRDLIRLAVLWSNRSPAALAFNRRIYQAAIDRFVTICSRFDEVTAVYLRHPPGEAGWIPGVSDIDLTVVMRDGDPPAREFAFLESFWRRISTLRSIFPMLGEIEVLRASHLLSWVRFGLEGRQARDWQQLYGDPARPCATPESPARFEREVFEYALWFHLQNLMDVWQRDSVPHLVRREDALRIERKIHRCLATAPGGMMQDPPASRGSDPTAIVLDVLGALDARVPAGRGESDGADAGRRRRWLIEQTSSRRAKPGPTIPMNGQSAWAASVRSIYRYRDDLAYIVLRNAARSPQHVTAARAIHKHFAAGTVRAVLLTPNLYTFMVAGLMPYNYSDMMRDSRLVFGEPCLTDIAPPSRTALRHDLVKQAPGLLMFPQSAEFILPGRDTARLREVLKLQLDRAMALKIHLESGIVATEMSGMRSSYLEAHPAEAGIIAGLLSQLDEPRRSPVAQDWFAFFRTLLDDIHAGLMRDARWEPFDDPYSGSAESCGGSA